MVPEYWLTEGGQSGTGALLDHIIESHLGESCCFPASPNAGPKAKGMVCGLTLDTSQNQLALQYLATVQIIHMAHVILLSTAMPMVTKLTRYYHVEALLRTHY